MYLYIFKSLINDPIEYWDMIAKVAKAIKNWSPLIGNLCSCSSLNYLKFICGKVFMWIFKHSGELNYILDSLSTPIEAS